MPRLHVLSGSDLGRWFDVEAGAVLGRNADCAVPLRANSVSRQHARVEQSSVGWRLRDLGSRNGIGKSGGSERAPLLELCDGDEFLVGDVLLRFRDTSPADGLAAGALSGGTPNAVAPAQPNASGEAAHSTIGALESGLEEIELEPLPVAPPTASHRQPQAPVPPLDASASSRTEFVRRMQQESSGGWLHGDLEQLPWYFKLGAGLLALGLCAGLGYGAYLLVTSVRT